MTLGFFLLQGCADGQLTSGPGVPDRLNENDAVDSVTDEMDRPSGPNSRQPNDPTDLESTPPIDDVPDEVVHPEPDPGTTRPLEPRTDDEEPEPEVPDEMNGDPFARHVWVRLSAPFPGSCTSWSIPDTGALYLRMASAEWPTRNHCPITCGGCPQPLTNASRPSSASMN